MQKAARAHLRNFFGKLASARAADRCEGAVPRAFWHFPPMWEIPHTSAAISITIALKQHHTDDMRDALASHAKLPISRPMERKSKEPGPMNAEENLLSDAQLADVVAAWVIAISLLLILIAWSFI